MIARAQVSWLITIVDNISASGIYLRLKQTVNQGAVLTILLRMTSDDADSISSDSGTLLAPRIALRGAVVRVESVSFGDDDAFGLGIAITENCFL